MSQGSGASAEVWFKTEDTEGVVKTTPVSGGASTTLSTAVNPGAGAITVASTVNMTAGDVLEVGSTENREFVKIESIAGNVVTLDAKTWINFRHESGEEVTEVTLDSGWTRLGNIRTFTATGGRAVTEDPILVGSRLLGGTREGNYDFSASLTASLGIENIGVYLLSVMSDDYASVGTAVGGGGSTTLSGAEAVGSTVLEVDSVTGFAADDFIQIDTGDAAEVAKILSVDAGPPSTITITAGLRKAHSAGVAVVEVEAPYTHTIKRGTRLPAGVTFLLRNNDLTQFFILAGCKFSRVSIANSPDDNIPTLTCDLVARKGQRLAFDLFGTPSKPAHTPYAHWEQVIKLDDTIVTTNKWENWTMNFNNNITARLALGSPFPGSLGLAEGRADFSASYQYEDETYHKRIAAGALTKVTVEFTFIEDTNHRLTFDWLKTRLGGDLMPAVGGKDPIVGNLTGIAQEDTTEATDVKISYTTNEAAIPVTL